MLLASINHCWSQRGLPSHPVHLRTVKWQERTWQREEISDLNKTSCSSWGKDYKCIDILETMGEPKRKKILRSSRGRLRAREKKSTWRSNGTKKVGKTLHSLPNCGLGMNVKFCPSSDPISECSFVRPVVQGKEEPTSIPAGLLKTFTVSVSQEGKYWPTKSLGAEEKLVHKHPGMKCFSASSEIIVFLGYYVQTPLHTPSALRFSS